MENNKKIRVSCFGDSITMGLCATSAEMGYPAVLGALLGEGYIASNFGKCGATVISDYEEVVDRYLPYVKTSEYERAMASEPDIAILMLGMNDANPTHHFNEQNGGAISEYYLSFYKKSLLDIVDGIQKLSSSPKVYLVKTTEMKREAGKTFSEDYVRNFRENIIKLREIQSEVSREKNITLIDTYDGMQNSDYYADGCHLTDMGYSKLAECIYKSL